MSRPGTGRRIEIRRAMALEGASAFTPASLPGLILWLRSDMGITLAGSKVWTWADMSGNGNDFAQGTDAWRPVYVASNANMGNKPSLTFSAGTIGLTRTDFALGLSNLSVGLSYRKSIAAGAPRIFGPPTAAGGSCNFIANSGANSFDAVCINVGTNLTRVMPDNINTNYSRIATVPISTAAANDPIVYTNGVASGSAVSSTASDGTIPSTTWNIGYLFDGDVTEVFAFNRIITAAEAAQLAAYQIARYT